MDFLFSTFDPQTIFFFNLNWLRIILIFYFLPCYKFWFLNSTNIWWIKVLRKDCHNEFISLFKKDYFWGQTHFFLTVIIVIRNMNLIGLFPYIFTATCHLPIGFFFSFILFFGPEIYHYIFSFKKIFIRIVPIGTPFLLLPFLVIIESIRIRIRPITLSIRLVANLRAGHLLLTLIGSSINITRNFVILFLVISVIIILFLLELSVAIIQGYVFTLLRLLYSNRLNE